ncbi:MAG: glucose-6-phosphate isomerase [Hyphomicrobiaceae bacterium]
MSTQDSGLTTIAGEDGRVLLRQDIRGCLETRIGASGLSEQSLDHWLGRLETPLAELKESYRNGAMPHLSIAAARDDIDEAEAAVAKLCEGASTVVFLGTGGSSLGGQTIAQLNGWNIPGGADAAQRRRPRTRFYDNLDGATLAGALASLDLGATRFVVISKSGGTPETLVQMAAALAAIREAGLDARIPHLFLGVSDPSPADKPNALRRACGQLGIPVLDHPRDIGGRFSCLSVVGLLPALVRGLDARAIRAGAQRAVDALANANGPDALMPAVAAAIVIGLANEGEIDISVMMPYADRLARFSHWYVQLWAESLGKDGEGTTPLACLGPLDQHSQLQLFMDGPKTHYLSVLRVNDAPKGPKIPKDLADLVGVPFMAERQVGDLVAAQASAIPEALGKAGRPVRTLDIDRLDEAAMGALMMNMMLETILAARLLEVNAFDQPAVELAKVLTRQRLS